MIYIIVGPSSSGKSSTRSYITKSFGVSGIDTDTLRTLTEAIRPDINVGHTKDIQTNYTNMSLTIENFLYARSFFKEDYLIEGDAINLEVVKTAMSKYPVKCIVIGYPDDTYKKRLDIYTLSDPSYWVHDVDKNTLSEKVRENIEFSKFLKSEANRLGLPFLEVSGLNTIDNNIQSIASALLK